MRFYLLIFVFFLCGFDKNIYFCAIITIKRKDFEVINK